MIVSCVANVVILWKWFQVMLLKDKKMIKETFWAMKLQDIWLRLELDAVSALRTSVLVVIRSPTISGKPVSKTRQEHVDTVIQSWPNLRQVWNQLSEMYVEVITASIWCKSHVIKYTSADILAMEETAKEVACHV